MRFLLLFCLLFVTGSGFAKTVKVLAIGNSFSVSVMHHLPKAAAAAGCDLQITSAMIGGCSLSRHWYNVTKAGDPNFKPYWVWTEPKIQNTEGARKALMVKNGNIPQLLAADKWDIVTIQQVSHQSWDPKSYQPYADQLIAKIKELAPQAEIVIQQTWAYCNADGRMGTVSQKPTWGFDQQGMYDRLTASYATLAKAHKFRVIPTGYAVQLFRKKLPVTFVPPTDEQKKVMTEPQLPDMGNEVVGRYYWARPRGQKANQPKKLFADTIHLNSTGEYLQACVWLSFLFNVDVTNLPYAPKAAGPHAALLRQCAQEAVRHFQLP